MHVGFHASLGEALAATLRVRMAAADPNGGADITGEILGAVSETHVILRAEDGQEFTVPTAGLRVVPVETAPASGVVASCGRPALTQAEEGVLRVILPELQAGRQAPTYADIAKRLGMVSKGAISLHVRRLAEKGYITYRPNAQQSIALAPAPDSITIRLPADLAARLEAHLGPWAATPDDVIAKALTDYLGRHA